MRNNVRESRPWARRRLAAAALVAPGLLLGPLGAASAVPAPTPMSWRIVDEYRSPSGDVYYFIRAKGRKVQFVIRSFVDFGKADICVKKKGTKAWVCHRRDLKPQKHEIYQAKIRWQGNYPTKGKAKRIVRFMKGAPKLSFRP